MTETTQESDMAIGLGFLFGAVGVGGALVMYLYASQQLLAGWGFALAIVAGTLAVTAIHVFS